VYLFFSGFAVEFAGYVWTVAVSGTKKLRTRKYPNTCGRGLKELKEAILNGTKMARFSDVDQSSSQIPVGFSVCVSYQYFEILLYFT